MSWKKCLGLAVVCALLMGCWPGATYAETHNQLQSGDQGKAVLEMKLRLQELGYFRADASLSESYNAICAERVQMFQEQNGLEATGVADSETLTLLYSGEAVAKDGSKKEPVAETSTKQESTSATNDATQDNNITPSVPTEGLIAFEDTDYDVTMNKTLKLKVVKQKIEGSVTYTWSSNNEAVATVNNGSVKGIAGGNATITCIAEDKKGNTYRAECNIRVIVPIKSIKADVSKIELAEQPWRAGSVPEGVTPCYSYKPTLTIEPMDATIQTLSWSSSKESVAIVAEDGTITGVGYGTATITGKATDGSGKQVQITVTVPKCYLTAKEVTISEPKSVYVGYAFARIGGISAYDWKTSSKAFALESHYSTTDEGVPTDYAYMGSDMSYMEIIPLKAGTGTITFTRNGSTIGTLTVKVEHSAVYDDVSYPKVELGTLLKDKTETGIKTQFTCKVIQVLEKEGDREPIAYGFVEEKGERLYVAFEYAATDVIAVDEMKNVYGIVDHYETYTLETGLQYDCVYMKQTHIE